MNNNEMEKKLLEDSIKEIIGCNISFNDYDIQEELKKLLYYKFANTEKLADFLDEIEEIRENYVDDPLTIWNDNENFVKLCDKQLDILSNELESAKSKDISLIILMVSSDIILEHLQEDMPNLKKIIEIYEKMKNENISVNYIGITNAILESLDKYYIQGIEDENELFKILNEDLEIFLNNNPAFKKYR